MKALITDALRYWEPRQLIYNGVLAVFVMAYLGPAGLAGGWPLLALLFVLAVGANIAYCVIYPVDLFLQYSAFAETWRRYRWGLFLIGLLLAVILAWLSLTGLVAG